MIAKTTTQRVKELHERRKAEGLKEIRGLWIHPSSEPAIRQYAERLERKRKKEEK